ncbi:MAG: hypothetical protein ACKOCX_02485 [Planctomycetota bacterium]
MARRKSKTSATGGNLDSMLDTLTNVVGILVIVLVAVQLSSQEAASKIAEAIENIDPQEVSRLEQAAEEARKEAAEAAEDLREQRQAVRNPQQELSRLEAALQIEQDLARQAETRAAELEKKREAEAKAAEEAAKQAAAERMKQEAETKALEERLAEMRRELENLPVRTAPPSKEVRLPDPRPAPQGAKELRVLCREGKVWVVDIAAIQEKAVKRADFVVRTKKLDPDKDNWILDGQKFLGEFNALSTREGGFKLSLKMANKQAMHIVLERGGGETADEAIRGTGDFARALRQVNPASHFVRFFVWPDAFEEYLKVREFTNERGFAAGWEPVASPDEHVLGMPKYLIGQKPPPPPPPPPGQAPKPPPPPPNLVD